MNELQKKIREDAGVTLIKMTNALFLHAKDTVKETGITPDQLLKLALGGRTESIFKKAAAILAAKREAELLALYQNAGIVPDLKAVGGKE